MDNESEAWADAQYKRAIYLLDQPGENYADNLERALTALTNAGTYYTYEKFPARWAGIMLELGSIYGLRRVGSKSENVQCSRNCYTEALKVFCRDSYPFQWAECQKGLGKAALRLADGVDVSCKEQAILHYQRALEVITKDNWPQLWHIIHLELSILYRRYALDTVNEDRRLAWRHYRIAFDLDKQRHWELYQTMMRLHVLSSELHDLQQELQQEIAAAGLGCAGSDGAGVQETTSPISKD
jgi:tetratricopeptide (TPR) repeat protein